MKPKRQILIISATQVDREPRVIRQYDSLVKNGFHVVVVGYSVNEHEQPFDGNFIPLNPIRSSIRSLKHELYLTTKTGHKIFVLFKIFQEYAKRIKEKVVTKLASTWFNSSVRSHFDCFDNFILEFYAKCSGMQSSKIRNLIREYILSNYNCQFSYIISHDPQTAFAGNLIAREFNAISVVDFHEHPVSQYGWDPKWRKFYKLIWALNNRIVQDADKFIFVSNGIKELMKKDFVISENETFVVRSVPSYEEVSIEKCISDEISIVYVGNIVVERGLEKGIQMLGRLPEFYNLYIQGYGDYLYIETLRKIARQNSCESRLHFIDPVPFRDIVKSISRFDFGYYVCENFGPQRDYSLPNKFFQYIMAGLCVITSNFNEISGLINEFKCGVIVASEEPSGIAETISKIDRVQLASYKNNSIQASKILCWENEEKELLQIFSTPN